MSSAERGHAPVLVHEIVAALAPSPGETLVDCTAGLGGHAAALAPALAPAGRIRLFDVDPANLARAGEAVRAAARGNDVVDVPSNFELVEPVLERRNERADLVLADLGIASSQLDDPARGFSFVRDGPLDMRLDPALGGTAADLVNALPERRLADLLFELGEEPMARRIAARIVEERSVAPLRTTEDLVRVVREAYGARARASRMHPATKTFMALRIAVNDELGALARLLESIERGARAAADGAPGWLAPGARVAVVSFHSLEDRLVKRSFRGLAREGAARELWKRPVEAGAEEVERNPRARSAKLRVLRLIGRC